MGSLGLCRASAGLSEQGSLVHLEHTGLPGDVSCPPGGNVHGVPAVCQVLVLGAPLDSSLPPVHCHGWPKMTTVANIRHPLGVCQALRILVMCEKLNCYSHFRDGDMEALNS